MGIERMYYLSIFLLPAYKAFFLFVLCAILLYSLRYKVAWPEPSSHRSVISLAVYKCPEGAYTASDNTPCVNIGSGYARLSFIVHVYY